MRLKSLVVIALLSPLTMQAQARIDPGMARLAVIARLGSPVGQRTLGEYTYLFYANGCERTCGSSDLVILRRDSVVGAFFRSSAREYTGAPITPAAGAPRRGGVIRPGRGSTGTGNPTTPAPAGAGAPRTLPASVPTATASPSGETVRTAPTTPAGVPAADAGGRPTGTPGAANPQFTPGTTQSGAGAPPRTSPAAPTRNPRDTVRAPAVPPPSGLTQTGKGRPPTTNDSTRRPPVSDTARRPLD